MDRTSAKPCKWRGCAASARRRPGETKPWSTETSAWATAGKESLGPPRPIGRKAWRSPWRSPKAWWPRTRRERKRRAACSDGIGRRAEKRRGFGRNGFRALNNGEIRSTRKESAKNEAAIARMPRAAQKKKPIGH